MSALTTYMTLALAIVAEVFATTALARSDGLSRLAPTLAAALGYAVALGLLAVVMRVMPTGIVYAIWSGTGVVLIVAAAWAFQGQRLDTAALIGLGLIVAGVVVVNVFSDSVRH